MDEGNKLNVEFKTSQKQITLGEIPEQISIFGNIFQNQTIEEYHLQVLQNDLLDTLTTLTIDGTDKVAIIILTTGGECTSSRHTSTLFFWKGNFQIFDTHGQNNRGPVEPAALLTFDSMEKCATYLFVLGKQLYAEQCTISSLCVKYAKTRDLAKKRESAKKKKRKSCEIQRRNKATDDERNVATEYQQKCRNIQQKLQKGYMTLDTNTQKDRKKTVYLQNYTEEKRRTQKEISSQKDVENIIATEHKQKYGKSKKKMEDSHSQIDEKKRKVLQQDRTEKTHVQLCKSIDEERRLIAREKKRRQCANMTTQKKQEVYTRRKERKADTILKKVLEKYIKEKDKLCEEECERHLSERCIITAKEKHSEIEGSHKEVPDHPRQKQKDFTLSYLSKNYEIVSKDKYGDKVENKYKTKNDKNLHEVKKKQQSLYYKNIQEKPIYICTCCHRMLYKKSTVIFKSEKYNWEHHCVQRALASDIRTLSSDKEEYICRTCEKHLKKKEPSMPAKAEANIGKLDPIPPILQNINDLEHRLFCKRIPFMKLVALPKGKQFGINGACVNVPTRLDSVCDLLPRMPEEAQIIDFKLKRKLKFKGHHMHSDIDPAKITNALNWLAQNNSKYQHIKIKDNFESVCMSNCMIKKLSKKAAEKQGLFQVEDIDDSDKTKQNTDQSKSEKESQLQKEDENIFDADQEEADRMASISMQPLSTCLQLDDVTNKTFCVAPGENQTPIYILKDDDFETMSFPDLFPYGRGISA